jgi:stringent starvation protein B
MAGSNMTSQRPYLLRAFHDWILDNGMTPHILVDAAGDHVVVPRQYVKDGKLVLNISPEAVKDLNIANDLVLCNARFNGRAFTLRVPVERVLAIYAKENGMGIVFSEEEAAAAKTQTDPLVKAPHLKLVK